VSANGSHPPDGGERRPLRERLLGSNLGCAGFGCTGLVLFLIVLVVATAHPLAVIIAGAVIMAAFGGAMLIWRE
jgi:hypothetical protein